MIYWYVHVMIPGPRVIRETRAGLSWSQTERETDKEAENNPNSVVCKYFLFTNFLVEKIFKGFLWSLNMLEENECKSFS